ncbi:putative LRR receptor-like serine/threonine-protein kinase [Acorus gramineus]|uniref:LRR receptor-like serine/threonine-protein kinase n=1 Tax=Acorus gramineus TaxID=55184 RepID=A0AAV9BD50_ACOGR|nr:putative LRR receptor-like serine/threonine-protein kinase [Acorus gramineus]
MVGPIPSTLSSLKNLIEIRISDMNGSMNVFPDLSQMVKMKILILRNCNISGELPDFLAQMTNLKVLDLSFNGLTGKIPKSFESLAKTKFIYLTSNSLSGTVPDWMLKKGKNIDLSYNNFTWLYTGSTSCQQGAVNLLGSSYITNSNSHEVVPCLTSSPCHGKNYYLHINCGGEEEKINHTRYVQDDDPGNARRYFESSNGGNWAFSSTGDFMDNDLDNEIYITRNKSTLSMPDAELYMQARISPISLTYYGLCLGYGNYTVNLHFAEIIITNDDSFSSLGKRIFDVYIQVNSQIIFILLHELEDFSIYGNFSVGETCSERLQHQR